MMQACRCYSRCSECRKSFSNTMALMPSAPLQFSTSHLYRSDDAIAMLSLMHRTVLGQRPEHFKQLFFLSIRCCEQNNHAFQPPPIQVTGAHERLAARGCKTICVGPSQHPQNAAHRDNGSQECENLPGLASRPRERLRKQIAFAMRFHLFHAPHVAYSPARSFLLLKLQLYSVSSFIVYRGGMLRGVALP